MFHATKQFLDPRALIPCRMDAFNEADIIRRCQAGDERAFRDLVDDYKDFVFALVARTIADRGQAEDLAQEVFLRIHRGLPYFRGQARLSTWIYRIVANLCVQERSRPRAITVSLDERDEDRPPREVGAPDPAFGDIEVRERLEKALERLPDQYRFLVVAHYLQGVQYEELAEALGVPLGTIKTQLYRAKRQLRLLLVDAGR